MIVTPVSRPARKLILLRSVKAICYFSYCEEVGCDWHDKILCAIPERLENPALLTLPPNLIKPGTGNTASGIEVPFDYDKPIPPRFDIIELPPCTMLFFNGDPFEKEEDYGIAIGSLWNQMNTYDPASDGYRYAPALAPYFNFGASAATGARMARPAVKI